MTSEATQPQRLDDEFTSEHHVYEPHTVGLPPLGSYLRALWNRRDFAVELARTNLRAQHFNTAFGLMWLVINPILLATVYFILVDILRGGDRGEDFFAHLMAALFAYYFLQQSMQQGVRSVVSGGRLILNTAFPRALLPLSSVITAFMRFLPTIVVYIPVHIVSGLPVGPELLWLFPILLILIVFAAAMAMLVAAVQVYFRDLKSFLPYATRIWMYATPILYFADEIERLDRYQWIPAINPLAPIITAWSTVIDKGQTPELSDLLIGTGWAVGAFLVAAIFFVSREREFAVRL